jgi:hypothetical protein
MIFMGARVVIPKALQSDLLRGLLKMHHQTTATGTTAFFWLNMDSEIVSLAGAYEECTSGLPSHPPESLQTHEVVSRPFSRSKQISANSNVVILSSK